MMFHMTGKNTSDVGMLTVGAEVEVQSEHLRALNVTKTKENVEETQKTHHHCIKNLIKWWMTEYPDYFEVGTHILSAEEKADPMMFYHTCDHNVIYSGL
jgi:hypothetical protein